ncbi:MAG TPA: type II secretion system protein GspG [Dissulfurispiraceae bacterium]|nr:type II secretion system protein GspG [Dissulfurispiraceae bacterium]
MKRGFPDSGIDICANMSAVKSRDEARRSSVAGYTLIEILAVVAIIAVLASIATLAYQAYIKNAKNRAAMADVQSLSAALVTYKADVGVYPDDLSAIPGGNRLDSWGNQYQYLNIQDATSNWQGSCRRDRKLNPLNTDFDLYSMGEDGGTAKPLTAKASQDDIVRANNGSFVGLGSDY